MHTVKDVRSPEGAGLPQDNTQFECHKSYRPRFPCLLQDNERHKECRVAVTAVAAYKERKAEELRARLDADDDMPVARRQLKA